MRREYCVYQNDIMVGCFETLEEAAMASHTLIAVWEAAESPGIASLMLYAYNTPYTYSPAGDIIEIVFIPNKEI